MQHTFDLNYLNGVNVVKTIRIRGDLKKAKTADGITVERKEQLFMGAEYGLVRCAPYDNHFIFDDPMFSKKKGRWTPCCTCGSPAGIVGSNAYARDGSPTTSLESTNPGQMIVCLAHAQNGKHADGSS